MHLRKNWTFRITSSLRKRLTLRWTSRPTKRPPIRLTSLTRTLPHRVPRRVMPQARDSLHHGGTQSNGAARSILSQDQACGLPTTARKQQRWRKPSETQMCPMERSLFTPIRIRPWAHQLDWLTGASVPWHPRHSLATPWSLFATVSLLLSSLASNLGIFLGVVPKLNESLSQSARVDSSCPNRNTHRLKR